MQAEELLNKIYHLTDKASIPDYVYNDYDAGKQQMAERIWCMLDEETYHCIVEHCENRVCGRGEFCFDCKERILNAK